MSVRLLAHAAFCGTLFAIFATTPSPAQVTPQGDSFPVNIYTTGNQANPDVDIDDEGNFVIVWESGRFSDPAQDGDSGGVFGRRFTNTGAPAAGEFQINTYTTEDQSKPTLALSSDGATFTVAWESYGQDGDRGGIFSQSFVGGVPQIPGDFQLSNDTLGSPRGAVVMFRESAGVPAVVARGAGPDECYCDEDECEECGDDFRAACDPFIARGGVCCACGAPVQNSVTGARAGLGGPRFVANTYTTGDQGRADMCAAADGSFVVVWSSYGQLGPDPGIFGQRFDAATERVGTEFQVNTHTTGYQSAADICCDADGGFMVVWASGDFEGPTQDGDKFGIFGRKYASDGVPFGPEFQVNVDTTGDQVAPSVACDGAGNSVAVWTDLNIPSALRGRVFDGNGQAVDAAFVVQASGSAPFGAEVAMADDGRFVVAWEAYLADGDKNGVEARRFSLDTGTTTSTTSTTVPPASGCGDPVALTAGASTLVTASDALFILNVAIGAGSCLDCVCDVDGSGSVAATDALAVLQRAVGQPVPFACPPCV